MRLRNFLYAVLACAVVTGCQKDVREFVPQTNPESTGEHISENSTVPGVMKIRVSEDLAARLLASADGSGCVEDFTDAGLVMDGIDILDVRTTFSIGGRYEARQRKAGLHRWFTVSFSEGTSLTKAASDLSGIDGVEYAQPVHKVRRMSVTMDDPRYSSQWHYYNTGQNDLKPGIDIRLQQAWDRYGVFGSPDVVVAIIDGGVDYTHEDLADNIWVNEAELNGTPGTDDDGNGYTDDIYGFNFVTMDNDINPEDHGTHVAGTVAAVNNNGTGVCGVAGGRYPDKGARLMCLQIMDERYPDMGVYLDRVFQYAADNGANIAQNSWGYENDMSEMPLSAKVAIDYFIENAGCDENGNQLPGSPMKGGLVVFAAGNESRDLSYPAAYEATLSVAAVGPFGKYAYYTNYGPWVDVCAPGGDTKAAIYGGVVSTIPQGYGAQQGTSMACPHVSGLAALILSAKGGEGFTCDDLFEAIVNSSDPSIYRYNTDMEGMLGKGMINSVRAFAYFSTAAPENVTGLETEVKSNTLAFTADIPADEDDGTAYFYNVYYSTEPFSQTDLEPVQSVSFDIESLPDTGENRKSFNLSGLEFNREYWYAVSAEDLAGNESELSEIYSVTTGKNHPPVISVSGETEFDLKSSEAKALQIYVTEEDGHAFTVSFDNMGNEAAIYTPISATEGTVSVNARNSGPGSYSCVLAATDEFGASSEVEIRYNILENRPPVQTAEIPSLVVTGIGGTASLEIQDYFTDPDGESLAVTASMSVEGIAGFSYLNGTATFTGESVGSTSVIIIVQDASGDSVSASFEIVVRDGTYPFDLYPNPVTDYLNVRTGEDTDADIRVYDAAGRTVYKGLSAVSAFAPVRIDMRECAPGRYTVAVTFNGKEHVRSVVKL